MAINLSDLTGASTSADILAEVQSTADFLDSVPLLKNLADPSGATDAKQFTATNQPTALPLIKNPSGDLGGYLYIPDVAGNYATGPSVTIGANQTWEGELDMVVTQWGNHMTPMGGGDWSLGFGLVFYASGYVRLFSKGIGAGTVSSGVTLGTPFNVKYGFDGSAIYVDIDGTRVYSDSSSGIVSLQSGSITHTLELNQQANIGNVGNYAIQKAKLTVNNAVVFDCDFNGSTSIRHGDTKFQAAVGGPVTINQSGNNPATVIKKPVLRFDGVDDGLKGLLGQTVTGGYFFAAYSVVGGGGQNFGRVASLNSTGETDTSINYAILAMRGGAAPATVTRSIINGIGQLDHDGMFSDDVKDVLFELKFTASNAVSKINNSNTQSVSGASTVDAEEFNIAVNSTGSNAGAIDLEYLALFPATITDSQADAVRNYINNRNSVFDLKDGFGYYFFDPQSLTTGAVTSWNGRIIGSDNGDVDKLATQATAADQPTSDGYKVTFADATDHLEIPSTTQAGWQVVGTSLGTFAYKVNANAVTELNLLGNLGSTAYRKTGDLYGIILLPENATNRDINEAKRLLIDRGASDGVNPTSLANFWVARGDIVEFGLVDTSSVTTFQSAWYNCSSLTSFPAIDASSGTNFIQALRYCSSLTTFPSNFFDSWRPASVSSGVFNNTWDGCSSLTAQSVENILTSIAASGKYATSTGLSGGTALTDATIDIDYNVSTGSLTAATLTAIETLNGRGWSVNINGVIQ